MNQASSGDAAFDAWLATNVVEQRQTGYAAAIVKVDQGNLTADQFRGIARLASTAGDGTVRVTIDQNLLLTFIPLARLPQVYAALQKLGLAESGAGEIDDVVTCPGAYSCNLALTKTMNLGAALQKAVRGYDDPPRQATHHQGQRLPQFVRPALDRRYRLLRQRPQDRRQGGAVLPDAPRRRIRRRGRRALRPGRSIGSRAAGAGCAQRACWIISSRTAHDGETFRQYVLRNKVETFRALTAEFAKPAELFPEIYQDWGDDAAFSLQLGRGECAA